jgi:pyrroline-5-carboxylate reductase
MITGGVVVNIKIGFLGTGNMGSTLIKGIIKSGIVRLENISIYDIDENKTAILHDDTGVLIAKNSCELVEKSDIIIMAVKPDVVSKALEPCKGSFDNKKILVSTAVGVPIITYKNIIGETKKIIRTMPNTPAIIGEGMTLISYEGRIIEKDLDIVKKLFECVGKVEILDEILMSEVTALTASSPAYVYILIEAMADAAVRSGLPRNISYRLAAQSVSGAAKMVLETGKHPGQLKDEVCSPAGTTIEAVSVLEKNGFRYAVMEAMDACTKRACEIGKEG